MVVFVGSSGGERGRQRRRRARARGISGGEFESRSGWKKIFFLNKHGKKIFSGRGKRGSWLFSGESAFLAYGACARSASGSENRVFLRHHPSP